MKVEGWYGVAKEEGKLPNFKANILSFLSKRKHIFIFYFLKEPQTSMNKILGSAKRFSIKAKITWHHKFLQSQNHCKLILLAIFELK